MAQITAMVFPSRSVSLIRIRGTDDCTKSEILFRLSQSLIDRRTANEWLEVGRSRGDVAATTSAVPSNRAERCRRQQSVLFFFTGQECSRSFPRKDGKEESQEKNKGFKRTSPEGSNIPLFFAGAFPKEGERGQAGKRKKKRERGNSASLPIAPPSQ